MIVFLGGLVIQSEMWNILESMNHRVVILIPMQETNQLKLRLDSKVFLFEELKSGFKISERYSIKSGPQMTHSVGLWSPENGLKVPTPR